MKINIPRISIETWTTSLGTAAAIKQAYANRHLIRVKSADIREGDPQDIINGYADTSTPDLMIIDLSLDKEQTIDFIENFKQVCSSKTKVVLIGQIDEVRFYQKLINEGISEYLIAPVTEENIVQTLGRIYHTSYAEAAGRLTVFFGATGGAGTSTIAQHAATASADLHDTPTLLADLDVAFGSAQLNMSAPAGNQDITAALFNSSRIEETFMAQIITRLSPRLDLLISPGTLEKPLEFDQETMDLLMDVLRHSAPHTFVDMPRGWQKWTQSTLALADEIVIVAQPDLIGLRNTKNLFQSLTALRRDTTVPHYVINMHNMAKRSEIKPTDFYDAIGTQALAIIPHDPKTLSAAATEGKSLINSDPTSQLSTLFSGIAAELIGSGTGTSRLSAKAKPRSLTAGAGISGLLTRMKKPRPATAG